MHVSTLVTAHMPVISCVARKQHDNEVERQRIGDREEGKIKKERERERKEGEKKRDGEWMERRGTRSEIEQSTTNQPNG